MKRSVLDPGHSSHEPSLYRICVFEVWRTQRGDAAWEMFIFMSPQSGVWTHKIWVVRFLGRLYPTGLVLQTVDLKILDQQHLQIVQTGLKLCDQFSSHRRQKGSPGKCQLCLWTSIPVWCCGSPLLDRRSVSHSLQMFLLRRQRGKVRSRHTDSFNMAAYSEPAQDTPQHSQVVRPE